MPSKLKQLAITQERDKRKSDWLAAHDIPQLIIKYDQFDQIEELVADFLYKIGALIKAA